VRESLIYERLKKVNIQVMLSKTIFGYAGKLGSLYGIDGVGLFLSWLTRKSRRFMTHMHLKVMPMSPMAKQQIMSSLNSSSPCHFGWPRTVRHSVSHHAQQKILLLSLLITRLFYNNTFWIFLPFCCTNPQLVRLSSF
jgi:hypothetical protein